MCHCVCRLVCCALAVVLVATHPGSLDLLPARSDWDCGGLASFYLSWRLCGPLVLPYGSCLGCVWIYCLCVVECVRMLFLLIARLLGSWCNSLCVTYCACFALGAVLDSCCGRVSAEPTRLPRPPLYPWPYSNWRWRSRRARPAGHEKTRSLRRRALTVAANLGGVTYGIQLSLVRRTGKPQPADRLRMSEQESTASPTSPWASAPKQSSMTRWSALPLVLLPAGAPAGRIDGPCQLDHQPCCWGCRPRWTGSRPSRRRAHLPCHPAHRPRRRSARRPGHPPPWAPAAAPAVTPGPPADRSGAARPPSPVCPRP